MIFQVVISKQAENDLRAIFEYITFELKSLQNAKRQLQRLKDKISTLNQFPERYKKMEKNPWYSFEMRSFSVDNYIVFYIVDNKKRVVNIIRIMYDGRNIEKQLTLYTNIEK